MIAFAYRESGMYGDACSTLLSVVDAGEAPIDVYSDLGTLLADELKDPSRAAEVILKGRELYPGDPLLLNNLAYAYLMGGRIADASNLLLGNEGLMASDSPVPPTTRTVLTATFGLLNLAMDNFDLGEQYYRRAHKLAVHSGNKQLASAVLEKMHLEIARANYRKGNMQETLKHVRLGSVVTGGMRPYERDLKELRNRLLPT